jgi:hypothetical protein
VPKRAQPTMSNRHMQQSSTETFTLESQHTHFLYNSYDTVIVFRCDSKKCKSVGSLGLSLVFSAIKAFMLFLTVCESTVMNCLEKLKFLKLLNVLKWVADVIMRFLFCLCKQTSKQILLSIFYSAQTRACTD